MKALLTASFDDASIARLERHMSVHVEDWKVTKNIFFEPEKMTAKIQEVGCDVLIVEADFVQREVIEATDLKIIGSCRGAPVNIDIEAATERGILVVNAPTANLLSATEHTFALMLAAARNVAVADAAAQGARTLAELSGGRFSLGLGGPGGGGPGATGSIGYSATTDGC